MSRELLPGGFGTITPEIVHEDISEWPKMCHNGMTQGYIRLRVSGVGDVDILPAHAVWLLNELYAKVQELKEFQAIHERCEKEREEEAKRNRPEYSPRHRYGLQAA